MNYCSRMFSRAVGVVTMFGAGAVPAGMVILVLGEILDRQVWEGTLLWTVSAVAGTWHLVHNLDRVVDLTRAKDRKSGPLWPGEQRSPTCTG